MKDNTRTNSLYNPNRGFIGKSEVQVSNYLFSKAKLRRGYKHAKPITDRLLNMEVSNHYQESKKLTKFLKARDLTFSKKTLSGEHKTFTVPCTTTIVPIQKSLFNDVEFAAQKLIISLRAVLQDIYGSKDIASAKFVKSLPTSVREVFITAIESSSNYFPQLHHPNMKKYPFLDNVGLDLVLVDDYITQSNSFPNLIAKNNEDELPGLPFRILELNAGSPSGASNNLNVLQGIYNNNPEILDDLGNMMPNDHFKILGETYKSLGEAWTKRKDGIQILLPPGGQNGAAPEIHQLAAYSGLIYTDADQLYQDDEGYIRLRTVSTENPIVTGVYSRINADSALYDPEKGLFMKDPDSAEELFLRDNLIKDEEDEGQIVYDSSGKPIPLESDYAIPGIIDAIINRKIYMGGLNRIVDNKIILATLTYYAPKFFGHKIEKAGLSTEGNQIRPPQTLPPTRKSVEIIEQNPDEWVVKAPSLAGGQGVYILKTLPKNVKEEVLEMIRENPEDFAYQQLVKIARIPVAVQRKAEGYKFANLAADIRTWIFFGAGKQKLPRMSHNALVRYAPQEKGRMSSIVNTSAGGGYAPFVIIDDTQNKEAVTAKELVKELEAVRIDTGLPVFVAAQMVQVSRMLKEANRLLATEQCQGQVFLNLAEAIKIQLKEILSFVHPRSIESIYKIIDLLETKISKADIKEYKEFIGDSQLKLVVILKEHDTQPEMKAIRDIIDNMRVISTDHVLLNYSAEDRALDLVMLEELSALSSYIKDDGFKATLTRVDRLLKRVILKERPDFTITMSSKKIIKRYLKEFCATVKGRLNASPKIASFAELFDLDADVTQLQFETLYLGKRDTDKEIKVASQLEMRSKQSLIESGHIDKELLRARNEWKKTISLSNTLSPEKREAFIRSKREVHFGKFPILAKYQEIIDQNKTDKESLISLLDIAPYAKFNIEHFAKEQGLTLDSIFTSELTPNRISILKESALKKHKLDKREFAGECFAKKRASHGLYSDSDVYVWIRDQINPFVMIYTAGHELIHYQQIKHSMNAEKRALKDGGLSISKFLNYYGNFLGSNQRTLEKVDADISSDRKPLYGYADRIESDSKKHIMKDLDKAIRTSDSAWESMLNEYGSLLGYTMPKSSGTKVKALQEVLPALENTKNILFAQELGLNINIDAIAAAMPAANENQINYYADEILEAARMPIANWEALRIIASHQYHGVSFDRADSEEENLKLVPIITPVTVGSSYNQTQQ